MSVARATSRPIWMLLCTHLERTVSHNVHGLPSGKTDGAMCARHCKVLNKINNNKIRLVWMLLCARLEGRPQHRVDVVQLSDQH